jgi:hypothetical protein
MMSRVGISRVVVEQAMVLLRLGTIPFISSAIVLYERYIGTTFLL